MWLLYERNVELCGKCKLAALCLVGGQMALMNRLAMCRQCGGVLLGSYIDVQTHIASTGQTNQFGSIDRSHTLVAASLPRCLKRDGITDWPETKLVEARICPYCIATSLNEALHELKESGTWEQWKEALAKSKLGRNLDEKFTA